MDNLIKLKRWLDKLKKIKKNNNNNNNKKWLKNKSKILYFWSKHTFPPVYFMVQGNYLDQHKEEAGGNLYYIGYKCRAVISAFCIVGNCQTPPIITDKKWSKEVEMFLIDYDMH